METVIISSGKRLNDDRFSNRKKEKNGTGFSWGVLAGMWIDDRDITLSDCDCIVNAADEMLLGGSGVTGAFAAE